MKIAILSPPMNPLTPTMKYGGIERVVLSLAQGCLSAGHDVTVYAPFGSRSTAWETRIYSEQKTTIRDAEISLFNTIIAHQNEYDVIHSFIEPVIARHKDFNYFENIRRPLIFTLENSTRIQEHISYYKRRKKLWHFQFVFISRNHASPMNFLPRQTMIYNGISLNNIDYSRTPKKQLAFLGRIMPEKGVKEAILLARILKMKLKIAAKIDKDYLEYFEKDIRPEFDGDIQYIGEVGPAERNVLLGESLASIFLINWHEPFGLAVVESLAAGTPVIARARGSLPEIIEDGKSGLVIPCECTIGECADLFRAKISSIRRGECRARAERFSEQRMVREYLRLYQRNQI